ncbi:hypothetical protein AGLY_006499 [Aphis glycines]|uniref:Uncharacterized protein n=1 Tax=Aphis glycines TaxID=307491 RepID=A0A6G0TRQ3_APHGL|nr:hypothetical protein AGLY_006499 [Aphis glycines]
MLTSRHVPTVRPIRIIQSDTGTHTKTEFLGEITCTRQVSQGFFLKATTYHFLRRHIQRETNGAQCAVITMTDRVVRTRRRSLYTCITALPFARTSGKRRDRECPGAGRVGCTGAPCGANERWCERMDFRRRRTVTSTPAGCRPPSKAVECGPAYVRVQTRAYTDHRPPQSLYTNFIRNLITNTISRLFILR